MTDLITGTDVRTHNNSGEFRKMDYPIGHPEWGQRVFLSGQERPLIAARRLVRTVHQVIPGVAPSAAYADGDALGVRFTITVPTSGTIVSVLLTDMDKEALAVSFLRLMMLFTSGTDNSAFDLADADRSKWVGTLSVSTYESLNDNALGNARGTWDYVAPEGVLHVQAIAHGVQNLTAATDYGVSLIIEDHS